LYINILFCGCIGAAYSCKGEHVKAIKWHEKYLQAAKKINNVTLEAQVFFFSGGQENQ
jgi:hypothetical protein